MEHSQIHSTRPPLPAYQSQRHYKRKKERKKEQKKERKLQANIFDEYRYKNPQQNISKWNSTIYKKDHTP